MISIWPRILVLLLALLPRAAMAQDTPFKAFFFGNSLVHHLTETPETSVPHWLDLLARANNHPFAADGTWGFLRNFAQTLPPVPNWSFRDLPRAWDPAQETFAQAGFNAIVITPANFIQYQAANAPYDGDNPTDQSPLGATLSLLDWAAQTAPDTQMFLYEGWAEMGGTFPPNAQTLSTYQARNQGAYHDWYQTTLTALNAARPDQHIRLIPVASVLARLLRETDLSRLAATDLYTDDAPHGTPTLYFLAALVTYATLFDHPLPPMLDLPQTIHPLVRETYAETARFITAATHPTPSLGMGLNGIADWSTQSPFIDVMKTARPWIGHLPNQWGGWEADRLRAEGYLDPNGWPTHLPPDVDRLESFILTDLPPQARNFAGRYRLSYKGEGRIEVTGRAQSIRYAPGEVWFSFDPGEGLVAITIRKTDPNGTGNYLRDIAVVREDHIPLFELSERFNPDWLALITDLRVLRFMDWMNTNASPVSHWDQRPQPSDFTYAWRGVPLEVMVDLANQTATDPWFTIPHMADDTFVKNFALQVKQSLNPRLKAYVEYSNELWNFGFPQTQWVAEQATARWGRKAGRDGWMQWAGMRAAQVAAIWTDTFGPDAPDRLIRVIATHTGWPGLEEPLLTAPLWVAEDRRANPAPATLFDAYAITGYFGIEMGGDDHAPQVLDWIAQGHPDAKLAKALRTGSLADLTTRLFPYHASVAARYGMDLVMYEGGTHLVGQGAWVNNPALTDLFTRFSYGPEMAALYADLLHGWQAAGGTLFNAFVDVAKPTQWGSWGAKRYLQDDNPRWTTLMTSNATRSGTWEQRAPGTFANGEVLRGSSAADRITGTAQRDVLVGLEGDDTLVSNGGPDGLHGGDGTDTAVLPGHAADYSFARLGAQLLVTGPQGVLRLVSIERLKFDAAPEQTYAVPPAN